LERDVWNTSEDKIGLKRRLKGAASDLLQIFGIRLGKFSKPLHLLGFKSSIYGLLCTLRILYSYIFVFLALNLACNKNSSRLFLFF